MSDEIKDFQIKIVTSADLKAAQDSAKALQDVGNASKESAGQQVIAGKEVEDVEKKAFASKAELKSAVEGLKNEFPALAHIARLAINPIAFMVYGVTGAFALWKSRIEAAMEALGGVKMPDTGESWTKAPREAAKSWHEYAEAIKKAVQHYHEAEASSVRYIAQLKAENDLRLAAIKSIHDLAAARLEAEKTTMPAGEYERKKAELGAATGKAETDTKAAGELDEWYAKNERVMELEREAKRKEEAARRIKVGEPGDYAGVAKEQKEQADEAEKRLKASIESVGSMKEYQAGEGSIFDRMATAFKINATLGRSPATIVGRNDPAIEEAIAMERQKQTGYRASMDSWKTFQQADVVREEARQRRKSLLDEAATARGAAATGMEDLIAQGGSLAAKRSADARNQTTAALAEAYKALADIRAQAVQLQKEMAKAVQSGAAVMAETLTKLKQLQAAQAEMEKRVRDMEGRAPRI